MASWKYMRDIQSEYGIVKSLYDWIKKNFTCAFETELYVVFLSELEEIHQMGYPEQSTTKKHEKWGMLYIWVDYSTNKSSVYNLHAERDDE